VLPPLRFYRCLPEFSFQFDTIILNFSVCEMHYALPLKPYLDV
jgi:hypothetical protein